MRDPVDYVLRWPRSIVADELRRLIALGESEGLSNEWADEVDTLLRQAFATSVAAEDFGRIQSAASWSDIYGDEEPF